MSRKILFAEDEKRMRILVSDFLEHEGYNVILASDGKQAIEKFNRNDDIELVILDVMMPYYNGWDVCDVIRKNSKVPIIMLTAKNNEPDELQGFKHGADEYITKPFSPLVFVARVNALYNRSYGDIKTEEINIGNLSINILEHRICCHNQQIELSQTEYNLLLCLVKNKGMVLSRNQLLNKVWGFEYEGTDRTVDTHINRLRIKLRECGYYIQTVRGYGYKIEVNK